MSSLYKKNNTWYLAVLYLGKRKSKSLKTKDYKVAIRLQPYVEAELIKELIGIKNPTKNLSFKEISKRYLKENYHWSKNTIELYSYILRYHIEGKPLPKNPTSKAIHTRVINQCWRWGLKHSLIVKAEFIMGDTKGEARNRVFSKYELDTLFKGIKNKSFNNFVRFAYYTGARSGEIRFMPEDSVKENYIVVKGKTGIRMVKLNEQAQEIIQNQKPLWSYSKDYVCKTFKKEIIKLGIKNARFHDLRRTFGLNLIKQGMSIYKVSKLLGHQSVRTTEQHYAPLMIVEIEDFIL